MVTAWLSFSLRPSTNTFFNSSRLLYLAICSMAGMYAGFGHSFLDAPGMLPNLVLWGMLGLAIGGAALWIEHRLSLCPKSTLIGGSVGVIVGLAATGLCMLIVALNVQQIPLFTPWFILPTFLLFPYLGMVLGIHIYKMLTPASSMIPTSNFPPNQFSSPLAVPKLLDSSAIIDGRILPLCTTGFLEGPLSVPRSVLHELQTLADSDHSFRRVKGKRGLEILSQLQQLQEMKVQVIENADPSITTVDHQLVATAKTNGGKIVTNDWNLAKIASLQGVLALNVNELSYQLRPLVLPGEIIHVLIQKAGQGPAQGIAHLDDGTMVVVDHGVGLVGQTVEVEVTRFMQTSTGRMIFASPRNNHPAITESHPLMHEHV